MPVASQYTLGCQPGSAHSCPFSGELALAMNAPSHHPCPQPVASYQLIAEPKGHCPLSRRWGRLCGAVSAPRGRQRQARLQLSPWPCSASSRPCRIPPEGMASTSQGLCLLASGLASGKPNPFQRHRKLFVLTCSHHISHTLNITKRAPKRKAQSQSPQCIVQGPL